MNDINQLNRLTEQIIGRVIEVHRNLGPGLLESLYEKALCYELKTCGLQYENQIQIPIIYKGIHLGDHRIDIIVEDKVILELKAANKHDPVFEAQLLSYLKLTNKKIGLLINFNVPIVKNGIKRIML